MVMIGLATFALAHGVAAIYSHRAARAARRANEAACARMRRAFERVAPK